MRLNDYNRKRRIKMLYQDVFNQYTLNIFTDASILQHINGTFTGCPGCVVVGCDENGKDYIIEVDHSIEPDSTNNNSEIKAIYKGILKALQYRNNFYYINLFSDSKISIEGLRNWIFGWAENMVDGVMYNSSGNKVANQEIISSIVNLIYYNRLNINLYHQKGHVKYKDDSLNNACNVFKKSNNLRFVDMNVIKKIAYYNNYIDNFTRERLENIISIPCDDTCNPVVRPLDGLDMNVYKKLIKGAV